MCVCPLGWDGYPRSTAAWQYRRRAFLCHHLAVKRRYSSSKWLVVLASPTCCHLAIGLEQLLADLLAYLNPGHAIFPYLGSVGYSRRLERLVIPHYLASAESRNVACYASSSLATPDPRTTTCLRAAQASITTKDTPARRGPIKQDNGWDRLRCT